MTPSLKKLKHTIQQIEPLINIRKNSISGSTRNELNISGLSDLRKAVNALHENQLLPTHVTDLQSSVIYSTGKNEMVLTHSEANELENKAKILKSLLIGISDLLNKVVPDESPESLDIKIPDAINNFELLAKIANEIDISISQPLRQSDLRAEVKINSVENGTITLNVDLVTALTDAAQVVTNGEFATGAAVGSGMALVYFVKNLIASAITIRKEKLEGDLLIQQIEELRARNSKIKVEDIAEEKKKELSDIKDREARKIIEEFYTDPEPDEKERVKRSLSVLADLLAKGVTITPAITNTNAQTLNFPTVLEQLLIKTDIKEIESPPKQGD